MKYKFRLYYVNHDKCDTEARIALCTIYDFIKKALSPLVAAVTRSFSEKVHYISENCTTIDKEKSTNIQDRYDRYINDSTITDENQLYSVKLPLKYDDKTNTFLFNELITIIQSNQKGVYMELRKLYCDETSLYFELKFSEKSNWIIIMNKIQTEIIQINEIN